MNHLITFSDAKRAIEFIRAQPEYANESIRDFIFNRAQDLNCSIEDCANDLICSGWDWYIDKFCNSKGIS
jgi:hypothetical protein